MKRNTRIITIMFGITLVFNAVLVATQTLPLGSQLPPNAAQIAVGGPLITIYVDANGTERSRVESTFITFDYANGVPRRLVVTQLADPLFRNGFEEATRAVPTNRGKQP